MLLAIGTLIESILDRIKTDRAIWRYIQCLGIEMGKPIEESTSALLSFIDDGMVYATS